MFRACGFWLLGAALAATPGAPAPRTSVAVMPLVGKRVDPGITQALTEILTLALGRTGHYDVMTADDVNALLKQEKAKESLGCDNLTCASDIAGALGTDEMITGSAVKLGNKITISLTLFDSKQLRVLKRAGTSVANDENLFERAMLTALSDLVGASFDGPPPATGGAADKALGETGWSPEQGAEQVIAEFVSDPPGAVVMLDGKLLCQDTSKGCRRSLSAGAHTVSMQRERYFDRTETVQIGKDARVVWPLVANFGWISVTSQPPGLDLVVDGKSVGKTPVDKLEVAAGRHEVLVQDRCYLSAGKAVQVGQNEGKQIDVAPEPRQAAITVTAEDKNGNAVDAEVLVDGVRLGVAPATLRVSVCAQQLVVKHATAGSFKAPLAIVERQVVPIRAVLSAAAPMCARQPRPRGVMVTEIQGLERLLAQVGKNDADRPALVLRLAYDYQELACAAEHDRTEADEAARSSPDQATAKREESESATKIRAAALAGAQKYCHEYVSSFPQAPQIERAKALAETLQASDPWAPR